MFALEMLFGSDLDKVAQSLLHSYVIGRKSCSGHGCTSLFTRSVVYFGSMWQRVYCSYLPYAYIFAFGVSEPFLDAELSRYIATGRLHAKIDKVGGVVETNRPDAKNTLYQDAIKKGDQLLNRIQKLSRVINV